jgi:tetratricopeptide (TPR) repeat protein
MRTYFLSAIAIILLLAATGFAQIDSICADAGISPGLDSPFAHVPYVYGQVTLKGFDPAKKPKILIIFQEGTQTPNKFAPGRSGSYCFRRVGSSGTITIEVDGIEAARRTLLSSSGSQQREDFEIEAAGGQQPSAPSVVSAKYARSPNPQTFELYAKLTEAERNKDVPQEIQIAIEIVSKDPTDYVAWAKLGSLYFSQEKFPEADSAYRKALEQRVDYVPAWINVGQLRVAQKQYPAAVEIFKHAIELEPGSPAIYRLLGESYLQAKQGSLAVEALDKAIELEPVGMAECHLLKAHLYELAGAKNLATKEYKAFLSKVPQYPDRKKLEKFIKDNPE